MGGVRSAHARLGPWRPLDLTRVGERARSGAARSMSCGSSRPTKAIDPPSLLTPAQGNLGCPLPTYLPTIVPAARPPTVPTTPTRSRELEHVRRHATDTDGVSPFAARPRRYPPETRT